MYPFPDVGLCALFKSFSAYISSDDRGRRDGVFSCEAGKGACPAVAPKRVVGVVCEIAGKGGCPAVAPKRVDGVVLDIAGIGRCPFLAPKRVLGTDNPQPILYCKVVCLAYDRCCGPGLDSHNTMNTVDECLNANPMSERFVVLVKWSFGWRGSECGC